MFKRFNIKVNPELKDLYIGNIDLIWSNHALAKSSIKSVKPVNNIMVGPGDVVEAEMMGSKVTKIVVRKKVKGSATDDVYVLVPYHKYWKVITVWKNLRTDNHKTLNLSRLVG